MAEVDRLWNAPAKSPAADRLDLLTLPIENYERQHDPTPDPDPIEFLNYIMENREIDLARNSCTSRCERISRTGHYFGGTGYADQAPQGGANRCEVTAN